MAFLAVGLRYHLFCIVLAGSLSRTLPTVYCLLPEAPLPGEADEATQAFFFFFAETEWSFLRNAGSLCPAFDLVSHPSPWCLPRFVFMKEREKEKL